MATASSMPIPYRQQRLLQLLCPLCLNLLQDPRLLSCQHIYCYKCLKEYHRMGNHGNALFCPQCEGVITLHKGGVDNLPKFVFMNEVKKVVMSEDGLKEDRPKTQKNRGVMCSTENCGQPNVKYCKQCEFLCQLCYKDHNNSGSTKSHQIISASEGEAFTEFPLPPYPPGRKHRKIEVICVLQRIVVNLV